MTPAHSFQQQQVEQFGMQFLPGRKLGGVFFKLFVKVLFYFVDQVRSRLAQHDSGRLMKDKHQNWNFTYSK